jgi:uncharacterized protein
MPELVRLLVRVLVGLPILIVLLYMITRVVRRFFRFPMPSFLANVIDNPLRRKLQPPATTAIRHGTDPGMAVLEVGPGNGVYTIATARRVGGSGRVIALDIEPRIAERIKKRSQTLGIMNVAALVADAHELPFEAGVFDVVYMIAVIGEIPAPDRAMREFRRVLSASGHLVLSEILFDPDYLCAKSIISRANAAGFELVRRVGNFLLHLGL